MPDDKILPPQVAAPGLEVVTSNAAPKKPKTKVSLESDITTPRWSHWYQRKLARPWQATLLGMNIEPSKSARSALQSLDPDRFRVYEDRMDIVSTLIGYEIHYLKDHLREGEGATRKYLELVEYCEYATKLGWHGLEEMRSGLKIDDAPPVLNPSQRKVNNQLKMLDIVFQNCVGDYLNPKNERSAAAVLRWFKEKEAECPIDEGALSMWLNQMIDLEKKVKKRQVDKT
ncbi:MAG: hypothetical protein Q8L87_20295 [Anaerolineales bacterium]|nr:hypothetical protein [Anaerolineales bacterium]